MKKTQHGFAKLYDVDEIGRRRVEELNLRTNKHIVTSIDVSYLGVCSIRKIPIIVALVKFETISAWKILPYTKENVHKYWGHCYIVKGKKIFHVGGRCYGIDIDKAIHNYEAEEIGKSVEKSCDNEIFHDALGTRTTKKTHISGSRRPTAHGESGTVGNLIVTRRFDNSRLTCVCRTKRY